MVNGKNIELMVSVIMITYKHELYIAQAIDGVLMQETDFEVELIVADDCSPDKTSEIVNDFVNNHPKGYKIKYFKHEKNIGMNANWMFAIQQCKGKYIANCEGDDYWTDPLKLQKQVDFLEQNTDFSMVGHLAKKIGNNTNSNKKDIIGVFNKDIFDYDDITTKNIRIPTASLVFKNEIKFPDWFFKVYGGDRALIYLASTIGKIKVLDFIGSIYRLHEGGIEQNYKKDKFALPKRNISENRIYLSIVPKRFRYKYLKANSWNYFYISLNYISQLKLINGFSSLYKSITFYFKYLWSLLYT